MTVSSAEDLETALRESEQRYRQLTESLPQLVWTCKPEGECDYLSPQWVAYTGIPEEVQLSTGWLEQIHPDDRAAILGAWLAAVRAGEPFRSETRIRRHDGEYRWFEARGVPLRDVENKIVKWFGVSNDIEETRKTRVALEAEQERLANLVALAPAVFCSYAVRANGSAYFPYASPDISDLYGFTPDDLEKDASGLFARFHPADAGNVAGSLKASAQTLSAWHAEFRYLHPTKGERWIEGHSTPSPHEDGSIVWHGFLADITERKHAEADQRFLIDLGAAMQGATTPEAIVQLATEMVSEYFALARCGLTAISVPRNEATVLHEHRRCGDLLPRTGTFPLTMWGSQHWLGVLGSGTALVVADTASDPITEPFYKNTFRPFQIQAIIAVPLRREGKLVSVLSLTVAEQHPWSRREIDLARAAAERIWPAYESARALAAERAMHQTLAASEERLRLTLESAAIGVWEQNPARKAIRWDARSQEIFGLAAVEPDLEAVMECVHPEDREIVRKRTLSYQDPAGNGRLELEFRIYTRDTGTLRYIYDLGRTIFEGEGANRRAVRSIGTVQDITALKQGERALRIANKELEDFAYIASHDLKAPLRVIDNASQWLEEDLAEHFTEETRDHMTLVHGRVKRMEKLLDDLLEYARIGRKTDESYAEIVTGEALMDNILALLSPEGFAVKVSPNFANIRVTRMPLQQVLMNLIGNAIKHHDKAEGRIEVTVEDGGMHYAFAVKDDGPGIAPRFHRQIFEMFQTLRPRDKVEGSGMGLAMVRKNIEVFGGTLGLESSEGQGSTFRFTWPKQQQRTDKMRNDSVGIPQPKESEDTCW
jgi:PAS domain S-box-containing protein